MMGELPANQNELFYDFNLEQVVPRDHLLRSIDRFLDFSDIKTLLADYYSHTGRPSVDPELMIRMLLVGYCYGIRSERRLCEEVRFNLAYRWFCRLGLDASVPNHSSFSKNRLGRFRDAGIFKEVFHAIVSCCVDEGLVKGEGFAIDGSQVRADVSSDRRIPTPVTWTSEQLNNRAVREYIETLEASSKHRRKQTSLSLTDPMAQWTAAKGPARFCYSTNYLIDTKHSIIMDVQASVSTYPKEVEALPEMLDRVNEKHNIKPKRLLGDTAYGTAESLHEIVDIRGIEPHVSVWEKSSRTDGTYSREAFQYDSEADQYTCPEGQVLSTNGRTNSDNFIRYLAKVSTCRECPRKAVCCPNTPARKITRHTYESARDKARAIIQSEDFVHSRAERKKVEMSFGHMKTHYGFRRLRLRGMASADDEFTLIACAQNLRKLARLRPMPPPS